MKKHSELHEANEKIDVPEQPAEAAPDTWPPAPETPNPLTAHDDGLTHLIRTSSLKRPMSRLLLVRELHKAAGLDLRQSISVVNDYCDRHGVLPQKSGPRPWLRFFVLMIWCAELLVSLIHQVIFLHQSAVAHTRAELNAAHASAWHWSVLILGLMLLTIPFVLWTAWSLDRQRRREAEEARSKAGP